MKTLHLTAEQFRLFDLYCKEVDFHVPAELPSTWEASIWDAVAHPFGLGRVANLGERILVLPGADPSLRAIRFKGPVRFRFTRIFKFEIDASFFDPKTTTTKDRTLRRYLKDEKGAELTWHYSPQDSLSDSQVVEFEFTWFPRWPEGMVNISLVADPVIEFIFDGILEEDRCRS